MNINVVLTSVILINVKTEGIDFTLKDVDLGDI